MRWLFWRKKKNVELPNDEVKQEAKEQIVETLELNEEEVKVAEEVLTNELLNIDELPVKDEQLDNPNYQVTLNDDETSKFYQMWRVRKENSMKTIKHFKTQKAAVDYAKQLADKAHTEVDVLERKNA